MDTTNPWLRVAGTALAIIRGRKTPEQALISAWGLLAEAGPRIGVEFRPDLAGLEQMHLPALPLTAAAFALQEQSLAQDAARRRKT
jgi:hypothetical protein